LLDGGEGFIVRSTSFKRLGSFRSRLIYHITLLSPNTDSRETLRKLDDYFRERGRKSTHDIRQSQELRERRDLPESLASLAPTRYLTASPDAENVDARPPSLFPSGLRPLASFWQLSAILFPALFFVHLLDLH